MRGVRSVSLSALNTALPLATPLRAPPLSPSDSESSVTSKQASYTGLPMDTEHANPPVFPRYKGRLVQSGDGNKESL